MKKVILLFAFVFIANVSFGQSMFDKLEDLDEVSSVVVNKDAFEILSKFKVESEDNEAMEVFKMIQDLQELKVFSTESAKVSAQMESMVKSSKPNRAEVNDIITILNSGASGLVLAAETAIGDYPVDAVEMINLIIKQYNRWTTESSFKEIIFQDN